MVARFDPPGPCPVCGADVPSGALACPECGACHASGWSEEAAYDALDLPNTAFDYESFVAEEFDGSGRDPKGRRWAFGAILVTVILLLWLLFG